MCTQLCLKEERMLSDVFSFIGHFHKCSTLHSKLVMAYAHHLSEWKTLLNYHSLFLSRVSLETALTPPAAPPQPRRATQQPSFPVEKRWRIPKGFQQVSKWNSGLKLVHCVNLQRRINTVRACGHDLWGGMKMYHQNDLHSCVVDSPVWNPSLTHHWRGPMMKMVAAVDLRNCSLDSTVSGFPCTSATLFLSSPPSQGWEWFWKIASCHPNTHTLGTR